MVVCSTTWEGSIWLISKQFRDALTLHYRRPLMDLPGTCNGCGATFTVDHALDCGFGGLVTNRHNDVWGAVGDLASLLWNPVRHEPIVKEGGDDEQGALVADLVICGVWQPRCEGILISGWWTQTLLCFPGCLMSVRDGQEMQILPGLPGSKSKFYPDMCVSWWVTWEGNRLFLHRLCDFLCANWEWPLDQWWAGFELDFHLPSCGLLYYVCVDYAPSGGVWVLLMAPLCPFSPMTNWLIIDFCVYV